MSITWKQFKEEVEAAGVKDSDEIYVIDLDLNPEPKSISVNISPFPECGSTRSLLIS